MNTATTAAATYPANESMGRDETIAAIRAALKARSFSTWSVSGGRGTAWGWIRISSPPARRDQFGQMTPEDAFELGHLLGLGRPAPLAGVSIPSSSDYYAEHVQRAQGRKPTVHGTPYWD